MSGRTRVAIARGSYKDLSDLEEAFGDRAELFEIDMGATPSDLAEAVAGADILVVTLEQLDRPRIEAIAGTVKVIGRSGIGLDSIDLGAAQDAGVAVIHQPDYGSREVATHAVALILSVHRRILEADRLARNGWGGRARLGDIPALDEMQAGVVGVGRIGRAVVDRLRPFVREIITYDPYATEVPEGVRHVEDLDELLATCGIVTLHLPLADETRNMIDADELARMRRDAILVNVSRGGLVNEHALASALADGTIAGAGFDVLTEEPPPPDHPLLTAPNFVLTPHIAWFSLASERRCKHWTVGDSLAFVTGGQIEGRVAVDHR